MNKDVRAAWDGARDIEAPYSTGAPRETRVSQTPRPWQTLSCASQTLSVPGWGRQPQTSVTDEDIEAQGAETVRARPRSRRRE